MRELNVPCKHAARRCPVPQVDLRSLKEICRDELLHADVYRGFVNIGRHTLTDALEHPTSDDSVVHAGVDRPGGSEQVYVGDEEEGGRRRYFVSLIDEGVYKKGVFQRMRKRQKVGVVGGAGERRSDRCRNRGRARTVAARHGSASDAE